MVSILPSARSGMEILGQYLGQGMTNANNQNFAAQQQQNMQNLRNQQAQAMHQMKLQENQAQKEKLYNSLIQNGIPERDAQLYVDLTTGGQTEYAKDIIEGRKRGAETFGERALKPVDKISNAMGLNEERPEQSQGMEQNQIPQEEQEILEPKKTNWQSDLKNVLSSQDEGLTAKEKVGRENDRYKTNLKEYQEGATKLRKSSSDRERLGILKDLNKSDKLPKNMGRLNVDKDGNLRAPYLATTEAQRYVKVLNEFTEGAKDSFGSRVTNFDLTQYLKRFPTLLNNQEGRGQILQQMEVVNDINSEYYKNLMKVYSKAGGIRKIDSDKANEIAEKMTTPKVEELSKKFKEIGQFSTKPAAAEFNGKKIRDKETGEIFQSNGSDWVKFE